MISTTNLPIKKRAARKFLQRPILDKLSNLDTPLQKAYNLSKVCSSFIEVKEGVSRSFFCKRTWCAICSPIRTAVRLNKYSSALGSLPGLTFTTLTVRNVPGVNLRETISLMRSVFRQFQNSYKYPISGVYNIEITYNYSTSRYHPHIHFIHSDFAQDEVSIYKGRNSNILIDYWKYKFPSCSLKAQDTRPCTDLKEGFKYSNKQFSFRKTKTGREYFLNAPAMDLIYQQIKGLRMFNSFGSLPVVIDEQNEFDILQAAACNAPDGIYKWTYSDWISIIDNIDFETGEINNTALTNYIPNQKTLKQVYEIEINN